jgi:hypothetical protein
VEVSVKVPVINEAFWRDGNLTITGEISDDVLIRKYRAKEVAEKYPWRRNINGVTFHEKLEVWLLPDCVGCVCPDFKNRRKPCKHIFAAAFLLGDADAILQSEPISTRSEHPKVSEEERGDRRWNPRLRPQDVQVGKYFVVSDFLYSEDAMLHGIPNVPSSLDGDEVEGMCGLCKHILDPIVDQFGSVSITFGYCSVQLWKFWYKDGSTNDLHTFRSQRGVLGGAVDITIHRHPDPRPVMNWVRDNCIYDRVIVYPGSRILCVAWTSKPRYQCKEWVFGDRLGDRPQYLDAGRDVPPRPR